jgi:acetolactate synthase-1/2/3 large subunit
MLASDYIVEQLVQWGITEFFILTGGAIAPFIDAIARNPRAIYFCFQHEQAASMAADGYYRAKGRPACVVVTSGPGAQNILNGLCGCWFDSVPALFVTGQVNVRESLDSISATPRQVGFQETTVIDCFRPFTKYFAKLSTVEDIVPCLRAAMTACLSGRRGPVVLDLPVNVQMTDMIDTGFVTSVSLAAEIPCPTRDGQTLLASLLAGCQRPVVVLGDGARDSMSAVISFVEKVGSPVVLS